MLFSSPKNAFADHRSESIKEQEREEHKFSEKIGSPRSLSGESTQVVNLARAALDSAVKRSKAVQESAKALKTQTAKALRAYRK